MKVFLLNPPYLPRFSRPQRSPAVTKSGTVYFPTWLASANGVLEDAGSETVLLDSPADNVALDETIERVRVFDPQMVVLSTSTPSIYNDVRVAERIKECLPECKTVLVGTHVSALPKETMELSPSIDFICRREYDETVRDLAQTVDGGGALDDVTGLTYRRDGEVVSNPDRELIQDLDAIPFVSRTYKKFLDIRNYFNPNALYPMVTIISGRGCVFRCLFCVYPQTMMGRGYRLRSVDNVVDEVEYITKEFPNGRAVFFEDDTMTVNRKRCVAISEEILRRGIRISWSANSRADLDYETMVVMKRAGCRCLCVGFESGDQSVLDGMQKSMNVDKMIKFSEDARRAGLYVHGCFMVGNPGETRESLRRTLDLAIRLEPDTAQFYPIMVYPGTEGYEWARSGGYLTTQDFSKWLTKDGLHASVVSTPELPAEDLVEFCDEARRRFFLRPRYMLKKLWQAVRDPAEGIRIVKASRTLLKYLWRGSYTASDRAETERES